MKSFLLSSAPVVIWIISILELVLFSFMIFRFVKTKSPLTILTALLTFGLFYDAFIIGLGVFIPASKMIFLSRMRFVSHGLLIPLLFAICAYAFDFNKKWRYTLFSITIVLMILGLLEALFTKLGVVEIAGISRMASIKGETPKWADLISRVLSFGTVIPLMGFGIASIVKTKNPHLFLSGFFMFLFSALGPATGNSELIFYISMYGELLMVIFLLLFAIKREKRII